MVARDAAIFQARRQGRPWAFSSCGTVSPDPFEGFEEVALPSGEVVDAFPVPVPTTGSVDRISCGLMLLEAFA